MKLLSLLPKSFQTAGRLERKAGWYYEICMNLHSIWRTNTGWPTKHDNRWKMQRNMGFCRRPDVGHGFLQSSSFYNSKWTSHYLPPFVSRCDSDNDHLLYTHGDDQHLKKSHHSCLPLSLMSCSFNHFTHTNNTTIICLPYCPTLSSQNHDDNLKLSLDCLAI